MCGIHLILGATGSGGNRIKQMLAACDHRGPDQSGIEPIGEKIWIGANRLKILDLSDNASQPMKSSNGKSVLVWNGAVYNYSELREKLILAGLVFQTRSDTEVLMYWLENHGDNGLVELNGMYSLIFINLEKQEILIARDPTGQKPLYYSHIDNRWIFSSEASGVAAAMDAKPTIDTSQFLPYTYYRFPWPDRSFFEGIRQLLPGEVLVLDFEGNILRQAKTDFAHGISSNSSNLESLLKKSVLSCFHSDRQAGMILSGGVDSSLIYALWYEQTGKALPTFTAHFGAKYNSRFSDLKYAQLLFKKYPSQHEGIQISKETLMANWQEYVLSMDQPVGDSAGFLAWYICKHIKSHVKALVSGAGADELFGGYNRHKAFLYYLKNPSLTSLVGKVIASLGMKTAQKFLASIEEKDEETFIQMAALYPIPSKHLAHFAAYYPKEEGDLKSALAFDRQFYLVNDILKIHDNTCMSHGIEGRAPYLDHDLIAYASQLSEQGLRNNIGKKNLKAMLNARGLSVISNRKKIGFGMPFGEWLEDQKFREFVFGPIWEMERTWGDQFPAEMRTLMHKPEALIDANFLLIWNWFVLASWLQINPA